MLYTYSYRRNILVINLTAWYIYNVESWQYSHLSSPIYSPSMMNEIRILFCSIILISGSSFFRFMTTCMYSIQLHQYSSYHHYIPPIILTFHIFASRLFIIFSNIFNILEFKRGWFAKYKRSRILIVQCTVASVVIMDTKGKY